MVQNKIQRMQVRQFVSFYFTPANSRKVFFYALGGDLTQQERIVLCLEGDDSNIGIIALVAEAGMRDLSKLNFHGCNLISLTRVEPRLSFARMPPAAPCVHWHER